MVSSDTKRVLGYTVLTVGMVLGLIGAYRNDSGLQKVNRDQTNFIIEQCKRDDTRNDIAVASLRGAKSRAIVTYKDNPILQAIETRKIQDQIDEFQNSPPCKLP